MNASVRVLAKDGYEYENTVMPARCAVLFENGRIWFGPTAKRVFSWGAFVVPLYGRIEIDSEMKPILEEERELTDWLTESSELLANEFERRAAEEAAKE